MLPAWMVYAIAIGLLASAAALALEHLLALWGVPRRAVWVVAMLKTALVPLYLSTRTPERALPRTAIAREVPVAVRGTAVRRVAPRLPWRIQVYRWSGRLDRKARIAWGAASTIVALIFATACGSMLRRRREWREGVLHGHRVWFTDNIGPAVVGFVRSRIVIPEWALSLPMRERRLMLEHEVEHVRANDPSLLLLTGIVIVLFPWNAALWFMARRLRVAIEIDCDARVIGRGGAAEEYGLFLVAVGERRAHGLFLAASLAERRSSLERRIHAMTMLRPRHPLLASLPFAAIALGAAALAAQTPTPPASRGGVVERAAAVSRLSYAIQLSENQVREIIAARHPTIANGSSEENVVSIVLASNGEVVLTGATELKEVPVAERAGAVRATVRAVPTEVPPQPMAARAVRVEEARRDTAASAAPVYWYVAAIGQIDRTLIKGSATVRYAAGVVAPHAISVNIVTLTGNSTGR
jgi:hypothetical protein